MSWSPRPLGSKNLPAAALAAALIFGAACQPDIATDPEPPENTTRAVFDPTSSTIPVPNSAALDADGTLRSLGMSTGADQVFNTWFDQLNGWLPETPITIPFSAALDETTLTADNIKLYTITADGLTELEATYVYTALPENPTPARATVTVIPKAPLAYGTSYGVVVTDGVKDTEGLSVRQDSAIFFALDKGPIVDEAGNITVPQLRPAADAPDAERAADIATAKSLEGLRRVLSPFYEQLKTQDAGGSKITRDRIVTAFSWRTSVDVFTVLDSATGTIPLPNTLAIEPDGTFPLAGLPALRAYKAACDAGQCPPLTAQVTLDTYLDGLHGWPNTAASIPIELPVSGEIDPSSITADAAQLWELNADGSATRVEDVSVEFIAERKIIKMRPKLDLKLDANYFAFVTRDIKSAGGLKLLPPAAVLLAMQPDPLVSAEGKSLVARVSDAQAPQIAAVQALLKPSMDAIRANASLDYDQLASVWTWFTWRDKFVQFDAARALLPLPNSLALEADGTFPGAALPTLTAYKTQLKAYQDAVDAGTDPLPARPERTAQVYFDQYLDRLHGWPNAVASLPIELPLTDDVDPATVTAESVQLWEQAADGSASRVMNVSVEYIAARRVVKLSPADNFKLNANYFAFATNALKTPAGETFLPPAPILLTMQADPLVDDAGKSLVSSLTDGQAAQLSAVQAQLKPAMAAISTAQGGLDDVAVVWGWFTWKDPFVQFDPTTGDIPFPNAFLVNSMTGLINLPTAGASGLQAALFQEFNTRDGFSVLGGAWLTITGELDEATLTTFTGTPNSNNSGAIGLGYVDGLPKLIAGDTGYEVKYFKDANKLFIQPLLPLRKSVTHAAIISERIKGTNGLSVQPTPVTVFLGSPSPLVDDAGKSLVAQLDDATAATLEPARNTYKQLFELGGPLLTGDDRETIAGMFAFSTDNANTPMQRQRAMAARKVADGDAGEMERACVATGDCIADPNYVVNPGAAYNGDFSGGAPQDFSNIAAIQFAGELESANFLDLATGTLKPYADAAAQKIGVTVYVPKTVVGTCEAPFDTVIVAHGVGGWRLSANAIANDLAASCLATVAIDFPLHGGRIVGSSNLHPKTYPATSGKDFLSADVLRTKSHFLQAASDLFALTESIKAGELENLVTGAGDTFSGNIGYLGISLGSIIGTSVVASDPNLEVVVLNVPSGKLSYFITEMSNIGQGLRDTLTTLLMTTADSFLFAQTVSLVQWALDFVDPVAAAPYMLTSTLNVVNFDPATGMFANAKNGGDDVKVSPAKILIQMAQDDQTTPNVGTRQLYESILMLVPTAQRPNQPLYPLEKATFNAEHGFILTTDTQAASFKASSCARRQAAAWLSSGLTTGTAAVPANLEATPCVAN